MTRASTGPMPLGLFVLVLGGCGLPVFVHDPPDPVVDGWPIGDAIDCAVVRDCDGLYATAIAGFDRRDPDHPPIHEASLHHEGVIFDPQTGHQILMTRSGSCCYVARFDLADGTTRAIGVGYPGVSREPVAIDYGP